MLKGKELYAAVRESGDELVGFMEGEALASSTGPDKVKEELQIKAVELGIALLADIAESLRRISVKVG
jgi:hypothetical protein